MKVKLEQFLKDYEEKVNKDNEADDWFSAASRRYDDKEKVRMVNEELRLLKLQEERVAQLKDRRKIIKVSCKI